jgi:hypothetical protein
MRTRLTTLGAAALAIAAIIAPLTAQSQTAKPAEITLVGCVELEKDYRARMDAGKGGVLGSGVGAANEFILTGAKPAKTDARGQRAVGTGGTMGDYALTGKMESELTRQINRQVEIVGVIETIDAHRSAEDAKTLPRLTISTWHPVADFCPRQ